MSGVYTEVHGGKEEGQEAQGCAKKGSHSGGVAAAGREGDWQAGSYTAGNEPN